MYGSCFGVIELEDLLGYIDCYFLILGIVEGISVRERDMSGSC